VPSASRFTLVARHHRPQFLANPLRSLDVADVLIYTTAICPYCVAAKNFLKSRGLGWTEVRVDTDPAQREQMLARTRRTSVPQIFIGDTHVGGYDDMVALDRAGGLAPLLEGKA
jgi:glutaredoxin 3